MQRNDLNGLEVLPEVLNNGTSSLTNAGIGAIGLPPGYDANVFTSTLWDDTDLTYILRSTLRLAGYGVHGGRLRASPGVPNRRVRGRAGALGGAHDPE